MSMLVAWVLQESLSAKTENTVAVNARMLDCFLTVTPLTQALCRPIHIESIMGSDGFEIYLLMYLWMYVCM